MLKTDSNYLINCVFVDEAAFNINMRTPYECSLTDTPAIILIPSTRAISHTIPRVISSQSNISVEVRGLLRPKKIKFVDSKKRKNTPPAKKKTIKTIAGHYLRFVSKMLDGMDKMIERRGYRIIYLPPYSPELNPIEQF
jgi:hypothetical protein